MVRTRESSQHDDTVIELVLERILGKFAREWGGLSEETQESVPRVFEIRAIRPDRPEVHKEAGMDNVKKDRDGENCPGDPVVDNPVKLNPNFWQERGKQ
jgi:hypothetical protein